MILVTIGTQLPFPRLIAAMDRLAPDLGEKVVAQIGPDNGAYPNLDLRSDIEPAQFEALLSQVRLVVGHAGIGTILAAQRHGKPVVIMPRRFELGEHRNDHQSATAELLRGRPGLFIADDEKALEDLLVSGQEIAGAANAVPASRTQLLGAVAHWLDDEA